MTTAILIVAGTIAGVLAGWYLALARGKTTESRVEAELRRQIATKEAEIISTAGEFSRL